VAAVSCSTPTHAAEVAVPEHCGQARARMRDAARRLEGHGHRAVITRARALASLSRAPAEHVARHRARAHQQIREMRASTRRRLAEGRELAATHLLVITRSADRAALEHERSAAALRRRAAELHRAGGGALARRTRDLERLALALAAHDPERALARGYALVEDDAGELVTSAAAARAAGAVSVRFHDDRVRARIEEDET
jgi:exodeoxyribonuclease VII large subunit